MADAVGLYATAMNDLGNIESIRSEPLNCQGGQPWVHFLLIRQNYIFNMIYNIYSENVCHPRSYHFKFCELSEKPYMIEGFHE